MFSDDGSTGRSAGHFILWQTHSTRDHLSLTAGKSGSTRSRDCHVRDQVPPDSEGGCLVAFKLREASASRAPGDDCTLAEREGIARGFASGPSLHQIAGRVEL